ncbi:hypothetical protein NEHOM01_2091 [Nematocida homosporus]|uniref:uncharacterized protein n=1 Tax=Nematocida homosporus TaxID=1912981 RepID=UPI00221E6220|nr:uncharacterized protein NEHOM01_2091 [Nematocida homosporus]KAI5187318.1 hypothetical protein NEHOM01_2091 [Nematocida homosporus]
MNSTQSDRGFSGKSIERLRQEEAYLISLLVREKLIQESVDILIEKLKDWMCRCNGSSYKLEQPQINAIDVVLPQVKRLNEIKRNLTALETQFETLEQPLETEITTIEACLIEISHGYDSKAIKEQFKTVMVEELDKLLSKIYMSAQSDLTKHLDSMDEEACSLMEKGKSADANPIQMCFCNAARQGEEVRETMRAVTKKLKMQNNASDRETDSTIFLSSSDGKPDRLEQGSCAGEAELDPKTILQRFLDNKDLFESDNEPVHKYKWSNNVEVNNTGQFILSINVRKDKSVSGVWEDQRCTKVTDAVYLLNERNENKLLQSSPERNESEQSKLLLLSLERNENELMVLLDALKKLSKIILDVENVRIWASRRFTGWLALSQLLRLFEKSDLNSTKNPLKIYVRSAKQATSLEERSFENVKEQDQFRDQITKIDKSRYILDLHFHQLTSNVQKFIWPLATHFSISNIDLIHPIITKIDFLDDVNWIDQFNLKIHLDYKEDTILSLGARTAKDKDLPTCKHLSITTNFSYKDQDSLNGLKVYVDNLDGYLQPKSSNKEDNVLTTKVTMSFSVLISYATFGLKQPVNVEELVVHGMLHKYPIDMIAALSAKFVDSYYKFAGLSAMHTANSEQMIETGKQLSRINPVAISSTAKPPFRGVISAKSVRLWLLESDQNVTQYELLMNLSGLIVTDSIPPPKSNPSPISS